MYLAPLAPRPRHTDHCGRITPTCVIIAKFSQNCISLFLSLPLYPYATMPIGILNDLPVDRTVEPSGRRLGREKVPVIVPADAVQPQSPSLTCSPEILVPGAIVGNAYILAARIK
jgi:hypothetical protein